MTAPPLVAATKLLWTAAGRRIVGPLDLRVGRGEIVGIIGPNGAGKTSLLRLLAGLLAQSDGTLSWRDTAYGTISRRGLARKIAYVPQLRPLHVPFTVEQFVGLGRYPHRRPLQLAPGPEDSRAVRVALEQVGLTSLAERRMEELSGGERQAAHLAAALAQESELLILDEPTTHLDPSHQRDIAQLLLKLNRELGRTVIVATHELNFAAAVASRLVGLKDGRILTQGEVSELTRPEVLESLFGAPFQLVEAGDRPQVLLRVTP